MEPQSKVIKALMQADKERKNNIFEGLPDVENLKGESRNEQNTTDSNASVEASPGISPDNGITACGDNPDSGSAGSNPGSENDFHVNRPPQPEKPERPEKYPGFDYTKTYAVGQMVFFVKINMLVGSKEFCELKLRSVYPKLLVGIEKDPKHAQAVCMGADVGNFIFTNRAEAVKFYDSVTVPSLYGSDEDDSMEVE